MPAIRGLISAGRAQGRPFRRSRRRCWSSSTPSELARAGGARHLLPGPFPAHQDPAAGARFRSGERRRRRDRSPASTPRSRPTAPTTPPITSAASIPTSPAMRDPNAVVYLVPGVGMITFATDKATARIAGRVLRQRHQRDARRLDASSTYVGLPEQEAFDIEYWLLEEAKLQRMPKPKSLAGRVALVTGGAGGIGRATAARLLRRGRLRRARRHRRARRSTRRDAELRQDATARTSCAASRST